MQKTTPLRAPIVSACAASTSQGASFMSMPVHDRFSGLWTKPPLPPPVTRKKRPFQATFDTLRNVRHILSSTPEELSDTILKKAAYNPDQIHISSSWGDYSSRSRYDPPDEECVPHHITRTKLIGLVVTFGSNCFSKETTLSMKLISTTTSPFVTTVN